LHAVDVVIKSGPKHRQEEAAWESLLSKYKFDRSDDFDLALMNYVDSMILDVDDVQGHPTEFMEIY